MSNQFAVDRLITNVRNNLPGALDATLKLEIFNTVYDLCSGSTIWQDEKVIVTKVDKDTYAVSASNHNAYYTQLLSVYNYDQDPDTLEWRTTHLVGAVLDGPDRLRLLTVPSSVFRVIATFAMAPVPTDRVGELPGIPDNFWNFYHSTIMEGVLGRMMSQAAKPYSNERLGIYHLRRFRSMIAIAKNEKDNGNVRGGQNWAYPQNFA